jgi:hypothetical protein
MWLVTMIVYQSTVLSLEPEGAQWPSFGSFSYLADWRSGNTPDFYAGDTGLEAWKCHVLPWLTVLWFFSLFLGGLWNSRPILESHVITAFHIPHAPFTSLILLQESAFETFSLNTTTTNRRFTLLLSSASTTFPLTLGCCSISHRSKVAARVPHPAPNHL